MTGIAVILGLLSVAIPTCNSVQTRWPFYSNERPIIGVLASEYNVTANQTYIAASYVKFLEAGGARVIPIRHGRQNVSYPETLDSINGILLPGGNDSLTSSTYAQLAKTIFQYATQANDKGDYFPIWGTCLGFEMLASLFVPQHDIFVNCSANGLSLPLNITKNATQGRLFGELPADIYQALLNKDVTANFHQRCLTPTNVTSSGLDKFINILSTNYDANGLEFVSTFEAIKYPFYGVQWHPEKVPWEWTTMENIPHSSDGVKVTQYFANLFVNEAKKSKHFYSNPNQEKTDLIYNINPRYSGKNDSSFEQIYLIKTG